MKKKYLDKTLVCRANYEDKHIPGKISFSSDSIDVKLVGFDGFFHFRDGSVIPLYLEDNEYCTVTSSSISSGSHNSGHGSCHYLRFFARQAIIGFRPWNSDDRITEIYFNLSNTNRLLEAPDIKKRISSSKIGDQVDNKILSASHDGVCIEIFSGYEMSWHDDNYSNSDPYGKVTFDTPKLISEIGRVFAVLRTFLTMAAGITVHTENYYISSEKDSHLRLLSGEPAPAQFQLIWPGDKLTEDKTLEQTRPTSILRCWNEEDRISTSKCLNFWMQNWELWSPAFSGLYIATQRKNNFDSYRIINACKWLDSTPGAQQISLENQSELSEVSAAAIAKSRELGLDLDDRIIGALQRLGTESRKSLLQRLILLALNGKYKDIEHRFLKDLQKAFEIRGRFAHSKFYHTSDEDFGDYIRCTQAVEALAFLVLYRNLPLPDNHFWGHGPNNFISYLDY